MNPLLFVAMLTMTSSIGVKVGSMLAQAAPKISGDWTLDLTTVCAVIAVVVPAAFYIGRTIQGLELKIKQGESRFDAVDSSIHDIKQQIQDLHCNRCHGCEEHDDRRRRRP